MKKSLHNLFIFIISIFFISGLSYFYTQTAFGKPSNPPSDNTYIPINEGPDDQPRCEAQDPKKAITLYGTANPCVDKSVLFTNGVFVKTPNTWFTIVGDPTASNTKLRNGGLFVGCEDNTNPVTSPAVRALCNDIDSSPDAYFNGDIVLDQLIGSSERQLCIDTAGKVVVCP